MRYRHAVVALATVGATLAGTGTAGAVDLVLCAAIPVGTAQQNYDNIQGCLDTYNTATLQSSTTYPVYQGIVVGTNDVLAGSWSTIKMAPNANSDPNLIKVLLTFTGSDAHVYGITFDADGKLTDVNDIVRFAEQTVDPENNLFENGAITGGAVSGRTLGNDPGPGGPTALSFRCTDCQGNVVDNVDMWNNYRVIGFHGPQNANGNTVKNSEISENQCDGASFAGYGRLVDNVFFNNGGYCKTLHGGGIYSEDNLEGGYMEGNVIHHTCGHGIDLIKGGYFTLIDNIVYSPGEIPEDTGHTFCGHATGLTMYNIRQSTVTGNTISNIDAPWNMRDNDPAVSKVFAQKGATPYSDLPNGERTLMAFALVWNGDQTYTTRSNVFTTNTFTARCSESNCLGVPAFIGRGTGVYANQSVDSTSRNKFNGTKIYGSEYTTWRHGRNTWAASYTCTSAASWSATGCNDDDYQWNSPNGTSPYRNIVDAYNGTYSSLPL